MNVHFDIKLFILEIFILILLIFLSIKKEYRIKSCYGKNIFNIIFHNNITIIIFGDKIIDFIDFNINYINRKISIYKTQKTQKTQKTSPIFGANFTQPDKVFTLLINSYYI
jgi:hypothetical protein